MFGKLPKKRGKLPKKRAKLARASLPKMHQQERTIAEHRALVRKMSLVALREMEQTLLLGWERAEVVRRIKEIMRGRAEFVASMQDMGVEKLRKLDSSEYPMWQRDEATKVIQRKERDFASVLASASLKELQALDSMVQPTWKRLAIKQLLDEQQKKDILEFRIYLSGLNLPKVSSLLSSFHEKWKNEAVVDRFEIVQSRAHEREVETFARSLLRMSIEKLEALTQSTPQVWKHNAIINRMTEKRLRQHARITAQFNVSLRGQGIEALCKMASSFPDGWQNEEICRRIIEMLPNTESAVLESLSKTSEAGLQREVLMVRDQIQLRKNRTRIKAVPKIRRGWT